MSINHVLKRVSSGSYALHAVFLSKDNMKTLYYSLIHSHLSYGILIWGSALQYQLRQLEVIQKKAVRNICKSYGSLCVFHVWGDIDLDLRPFKVIIYVWGQHRPISVYKKNIEHFLWLSFCDMTVH